MTKRLAKYVRYTKVSLYLKRRSKTKRPKTEQGNIFTRAKIAQFLFYLVSIFLACSLGLMQISGEFLQNRKG